MNNQTNNPPLIARGGYNLRTKKENNQVFILSILGTMILDLILTYIINPIGLIITITLFIIFGSTAIYILIALTFLDVVTAMIDGIKEEI